jgi:hypothetical protein
MATLYCTPSYDSILKLAVTEQDKTTLMGNQPADSYATLTLTDDDVEKMRLEEHTWSISSTGITLTARGAADEVGISTGHNNKDAMDLEISIMAQVIRQFLKRNKTHTDYDKWNTYLTNITSIDTSSLTFPYAKTINRHLKDNSLPYYSLLELP